MKNLLRKTTMIITAAMSLISMNVISASAANTKNVDWSVTSDKVCMRTGAKEDDSSIYIYNQSGNAASLSVYGISDDERGIQMVSTYQGKSYKTLGLTVPKYRECLVYQFVYEKHCESAYIEISRINGKNANGVWSPDSVILGNYTVLN